MSSIKLIARHFVLFATLTWYTFFARKTNIQRRQERSTRMPKPGKGGSFKRLERMGST